MAVHRLEAGPGTVVDVFDPAAPPALVVEPGDTVVVRSLDASGSLRRQGVPGERVPTMFADRRGHCLTGPVAVAGARPGDVLAVRLVSLVPDPWGWTVAGAKDTALNRALGLAPGLVPREPTWLLWDLDVANGVGRTQHGFTVRLAPFLGVLGVAPAEPGEHPTVPPRPGCGGNVDCRDLVAGSTLYLPVQVDGGLLSLGDGHAAQGDGEVSGTAVECGMTTELVVDVVRGRPAPGVHAVTPAGRTTFGFDPDLDEAAAQALAAMVTWVEHDYGVDRGTATALASAVVDLRVTQVANETFGVHAVLPHGALR